MDNNIYLYKTDEEIENMRKAGRLAARVLDEVCKMAKEGLSTWDLDVFAETWIREHGAIPTFKGYMNFPCTLCTSVNQEVVHGIPNKTKILREGDIVSIDVGVTLKAKCNGSGETNFIGDNARTVMIGKVNPKVQTLIKDNEIIVLEATKKCVIGNKTSEIARMIEDFSREKGYGSIKEFGGHGIGPNYHSAPFMPNFTEYFREFPDVRFQEGMVVAIEPMFTLGLGAIRKLKDDWTVVTKDSKVASHHELSVLVTKDGPEVLTVLD